MSAIQLSVEQQMLAILALDDDASIRFSDVTHQWYLVIRPDISNGLTLCSIAEHASSPDLAVHALFKRITELGKGECLSTESDGERIHWRWNGFMWKRMHKAGDHN